MFHISISERSEYTRSEYRVIETSDQCIVFKRGSSLQPSEGLVIKNTQLHVPLISCSIFDMTPGSENVYKVNVRKTLKLDQLYTILRFHVRNIAIPFVCKKHFSKKCFTEYVNVDSKANFIKYVRLVSTPDNKNETLEISIDVSRLPKKIEGYKVIKLGEEFIVSAKTIACDVSKFETKTSLPEYTTPRITKRKFEIPYPIKLATGFVAFFGVLEIGSALISKVVNKIK